MCPPAPAAAAPPPSSPGRLVAACISSATPAADRRRVMRAVAQNMGACFPQAWSPRAASNRSALIRLGVLDAVVLLQDGGGGRVAASCTLVHREEFGTCEMQDVCVRPELRGQGLCGRLARASLAHLRRAGGVRELHVFCHRSNAAACRCYAGVFGAPVHTTPDTTAFVKRLKP